MENTFSQTAFSIESCSKKDLLRKFQMVGYSVKSDALAYLENEFINGYPPYPSVDEFIRLVCGCILREFSSDSALIDIELAEKVVLQLKKDSGQLAKEVCHKLRVKNISIDVSTSKDAHKLHNRHMDQRFQMFLKQLEESNQSSSNSFETKKIVSITNTFKATLNCNVFGFLRKNLKKINEYYLEDDTGTVTLNFSAESEYKNPLILENSFLLVEGVFHSLANCLIVHRIGYLPFNVLYEGIDQRGLEQSQVENQDANMFVFLRELYLDQREIWEKLKKMFSVYNSVDKTPHFFILIGPFTKDAQEKSAFQDFLRLLLNVISRFPNLVQISTFIFVPGIEEDASDFIRPPIDDEKELLNGQESQIKFYFATNPVHLFVNNKHICVFSSNLLRMAKKKIFFQRRLSDEQFCEEIGRIIVSNAYLGPGICSQFNNSLSLHHLPDLIVFADDSDRLGPEYMNFNLSGKVQFINIHSFSRKDFKFKVYYSETGLIEDSQINI